jgi:hypothetical protein
MLNEDIAPADPTPLDTTPPAPEIAGPPRRILCVFPLYEPSLGSLDYAYDITGTLRAFMPPQGLLVIAAALPEGWEVCFVDENISRVKRSDFKWADAVFVSGMHVQRRQIDDIRGARKSTASRPCSAARRFPLVRNPIPISTIFTLGRWATLPANFLRACRAIARGRQSRSFSRRVNARRSKSSQFPPMSW